MNAIKKVCLLIIILLVIISLSSCGYIFPHIATVEIENRTKGTYLKDGEIVREEVKYTDMYIHGAGVETKKLELEVGEKKAFQLSWFGERSNFKISTHYKHSATWKGADYQAGLEHAPYYLIQDVGNNDIISVKFTTQEGVVYANISKNHIRQNDIDEVSR